MKVIILAAGIGQRLGDQSQDKPKCLLRFGGMSLLHRHLLALATFPIDEIRIVTGYKQELIRDEIAQIDHKHNITYSYNQDYQAGSVISLCSAGEILTSGDDIILMDADVLYAPQILSVLIHTQHANCFLLDREFEAGDEPVKLCVKDKQLIDFRKQIDEDLKYDYQGESVGFFRFSPDIAAKLAGQCKSYINTGRRDEPYEESIRDLLLAEPQCFSFEDITGLPWIEIDFPEDIVEAEQYILSAITKDG